MATAVPRLGKEEGWLNSTDLNVSHTNCLMGVVVFSSSCKWLRAFRSLEKGAAGAALHGATAVKWRRFPFRLVQKRREGLKGLAWERGGSSRELVGTSPHPPRSSLRPDVRGPRAPRMFKKWVGTREWSKKLMHSVGSWGGGDVVIGRVLVSLIDWYCKKQQRFF